MLHLHRAERADGLVEALAEVVAEPLADPLEPEVVAVPAREVERWLIQRLSARLGAVPGREDGVCANIDFPFPGRLVGGAVAAARGVDPETEPWLPERLVWRLVEVVEGCLSEPWIATLAAHLGRAGPDADRARWGRRFSAVHHVADLYDRYGVHRPEMLRAWAEGEDSDGSGAAPPRGNLVAGGAVAAPAGLPRPAQPGATARRRLRDPDRRPGGVRPARPAFPLRPHPRLPASIARSSSLQRWLWGA